MMTKKQNMIFTFGIMNTIMSVAMSIAALLINVGFITIPMFVVTLASVYHLERHIQCNAEYYLHEYIYDFDQRRLYTRLLPCMAPRLPWT